MGHNSMEPLRTGVSPSHGGHPRATGKPPHCEEEQAAASNSHRTVSPAPQDRVAREAMIDRMILARIEAEQIRLELEAGAEEQIPSLKKTYKVIAALSKEFGIRRLCRLAGVDPSGYYRWKKAEAQAEADGISTDTFAQIAAQWKEDCLPQYRPSSVQKYMSSLNNYHLPEFGDRPIAEITREDVENYYGELMLHGKNGNDKLTPQALASVFVVLKAVFKYAEEAKGLPVADIGGIFDRSGQSSGARPLMRGEQEHLEYYLTENPTPLHLGILLCLGTGLKLGELCALTWTDISCSERTLRIHKTMQRVKTMDGARTEIVISEIANRFAVRTLPIPERLAAMTEQTRKADRCFFLSGTPDLLDPRGVQYRLKAILRDCRIEGVSFQSLRNTFIARCTELGLDGRILNAVLGKANGRQTEFSVPVTMEEKRRLLELVAMPQN